MALNGRAYAVDLDRLRAAFGSKDRELLKEIVWSQAESMKPFGPPDGPREPPAYSLPDAVADVIDGEFRAGDQDRHLYGYAIDALCRHFGEVVPVPGDEPFNEIGDPADLEIDTGLLDGDLPLPVPRWADTPYVRFLTAAQVAEEFARLSNADLSHEDPTIEEGRLTLRDQLKWAMDRGKALVTVVNG